MTPYGLGIGQNDDNDITYRLQISAIAVADAAVVRNLLELSDGDGEPLEVWVRDRFEEAFGVGLGVVRVHRGRRAQDLTSRLGVPAATSGTHVFLSADVADLDTPRSWLVLAHELDHAIWQGERRRSPGVAALDRQGLECHADLAGLMAVTGRTCRRPRGELQPVPPSEGILQAFNSWEHKLLEDAPPDDLRAILDRTDLEKAQAAIDRQTSLAYLWQGGPTSVTSPSPLQRVVPTVRSLTLAGSGLLVTAGEINAMADYVASPDALDRLPSAVIGPLLQQIRQETYNTLRYRAALFPDSQPTQFVGNVLDDPGPKPSSYQKYQLLSRTELVTQAQAPNDYYGLLAKNACHFAPFAWWRFAAFRQAAQGWTSAGTSDPRKALLNLAFANHFLTDCFAAGHLTNKTLVMQWFIDYVKNSWWGYTYQVGDWKRVSQMTTDRQPDLVGDSLYAFPDQPTDYRGVSNDPQTVSEGVNYSVRVMRSGVRATGDVTADQAYQQYWAFLSANEPQYASAEAHDYFNDKSLSVMSRDRSSGPFTIWGDDHLLKYGPTAIDAIIDALGASNTQLAASGTVATPAVIGKLPGVVTGIESRPIELSDWHSDYLQSQLTSGVLGGWKNMVVGLTYDFSGISVDQGAEAGKMRSIWQKPLAGHPFQILLDGVGHIWVVASPSPLIPSSVTRYQTLDGAPTTITGLQHDNWPLRLTTDGVETLAAYRSNGQATVSRLPTVGLSPTWTMSIGGSTVPAIAMLGGGRFFAATGGNVYVCTENSVAPNPYPLPTSGAREAIVATTTARSGPDDHRLIVYQDGWLTALTHDVDGFHSRWQKQVVSNGLHQQAGMWVGNLVLLSAGPDSIDMSCSPATLQPYDLEGTPLPVPAPPAPVYMPIFGTGWNPLIIGSNGFVIAIGADGSTWFRAVDHTPRQGPLDGPAVASDGTTVWYALSDGTIGGLDHVTGDPRPTQATASVPGQDDPVLASDGANVYVARTGTIQAFSIPKPT